MSVIFGATNMVARRYVHHHMERGDLYRFLGINSSNKRPSNRNTHLREAKFRKSRGRKFVPIVLPDETLEKKRDTMTPTEVRIALMRRGFNPGRDVQMRQWSEQQLTFQSFYGVVDNYVPPENTLSLTPNVEGGKAILGEVKDRIRNRWSSYWNGVKRIRKKEGFQKFKPADFVENAQEIYVNAFQALADRDVDRLLGLVTEHAYLKLWPDVSQGTLVWEFLGFKSPSKVISVRCGDYPYESGNDIAQVTVRMHVAEKYALYDRFGKLRLDNTVEPKDSVEYVVFENHISSVDGVWRFHDKVYPEWYTPKSILPEKLKDSTQHVNDESESATEIKNTS